MSSARMHRIPFVPILSAVVFVVAATLGRPAVDRAGSQESGQQQAPPNTQAPQKQGQPQTSPADDPNYARYNAEKDIEVGMFYMHKGDIDAAIPRFEDAAKLRPDYGKPRLLLAEAYEKKHDPAAAVKYYKEYLKVFPHAPDASRVEKKIAKLESH